MTAPTKVLLAAAALIAGILCWLAPGDEVSPPTPWRSSAPDNREASANVAAPLAIDRTTAPEFASPAKELQVDWLVHPFAYELDARVIDSLGLPVASHQVVLGPIGCSRNLAAVATDADGRTRIRWHGRCSQMMVEVEDPRGRMRRIAVRSGAKTSVVLLGDESQPSLYLQFTAVGGDALAAQLPDLEKLIGMRTTGALQSGTLLMRSGLHPFANFADRIGLLEVPPSAGPGSRIVINKRSASFEIGFAPYGEDLAPTRGITGTVLHTDGEPRNEVPVVLLGSNPQPLQRTVTDQHGAFRFKNVVAGNFTIRAGGDRHGLAVTPVVVTTGTTSSSLRLHPGAAVRGRAITADDHPAADHMVEWLSLDGSWADSTRTDRNGTFVLANLPGGPGTVQLLRPGLVSQQPIVVVANVLPDHDELILRLPPDPGSTLKLQPLRVDGLAEPPVLHIWNTDTGLGTRIQSPGGGDVWQLANLPSGFYDLDAWVPGAGHRALGRHWLDGTAPVDLGRVDLPRGGTVQFSIAADALPSDATQRVLELVSLRADADVFVALEEIPNDRVVHLPAGNHALLYRHADGSSRAQRFTVKVGERTEVAIAR